MSGPQELTTYLFRNSKTSQTAEVAVCRVFTTARRTGRMPRRAAWLIFIVIGPELAGLSPRAVRRLYRQRFGVETSYRCAGLDHLAERGLPVRALGPELFYGQRVGASVWVLHAGITSWRAMV
ncbi:MAG: hypothetical protein IH820_01640 [Bacteroidetes bacterium]|nr:hypothetical protein [Bacteroidota bacterium]